MSTDTAETLEFWGRQFVVTESLRSDPPAWDSAKRLEIEAAREAAEKDGYELIGEPGFTEEPAAWIQEWDDGRGGLIPLSMARMCTGYDGEPTAHYCRYRWPARKKPARRLQRKDIDDQHVIDLAQQWQDAPPLGHPGVVAALVAEGIPEKLALSKVEHLYDRGYLECGTSPYFSWPTGKRLP